MAFTKAIQHGKTKRKPFRGGKRVDSRCRNHGRCGYCRSNRTHANSIRQQSAQDQLDQDR